MRQRPGRGGLRASTPTSQPRETWKRVVVHMGEREREEAGRTGSYIYAAVGSAIRVSRHLNFIHNSTEGNWPTAETPGLSSTAIECIWTQAPRHDLSTAQKEKARTPIPPLDVVAPSDTVGEEGYFEYLQRVTVMVPKDCVALTVMVRSRVSAIKATQSFGTSSSSAAVIISSDSGSRQGEGELQALRHLRFQLQRIIHNQLLGCVCDSQANLAASGYLS